MSQNHAHPREISPIRDQSGGRNHPALNFDSETPLGCKLEQCSDIVSRLVPPGLPGKPNEIGNITQCERTRCHHSVPLDHGASKPGSSTRRKCTRPKQSPATTVLPSAAIAQQRIGPSE